MAWGGWSLFLNKTAEKLGLFGFLNKQRSSDFTFPFCPYINVSEVCKAVKYRH